MNIVLVAPHQWPIPTPAHTGHVVILDLAQALVQRGHDVSLIAPEGTKRFGGSGGGSARLLSMNCSHGTAAPTAEHCERAALVVHEPMLKAADIIHDWSVEKHIADAYPDKSVSTVMSGNTSHPKHGRNVVVWSGEMRERALRGASDYEGTEFTQWHSMSRPLKDARIVPGGVDTDWYTPAPLMSTPGGLPAGGPLVQDAAGRCFDYRKEDFILWLGRWHEARGYRLAIDVARSMPDQQFVIAGEHPDDCTNDHQKQCAIDARQCAIALGNVRNEWLPKDGHHEAKRELYRRARAFLFTPRFREPFGLSQVEALACGTPVVGTNIGSVPEVIENCVTGLVVEPFYLKQACEKVRNIRPEKCREEAVRRFDRKVMAANYVRAYEAALKGGWG